MAKPYNNRHVRTAGRMAVRGIERTGKWMATANAKTNRRQVSIMETMQSCNFNLAQMSLIVRRMERGNDYVKVLMDTGVEVGFMEVAFDWIVDHLLFLWDIIWGFIEPILSMLWWTVARIALIIICNVVFFGVIYLLLTAKPRH